MHRTSCRFMPPCGITETLSDVESVRVVHAFIDGKESFSFDRGKRIETDMEGKEHLKENDL